MCKASFLPVEKKRDFYRGFFVYREYDLYVG